MGGITSSSYCGKSEATGGKNTRDQLTSIAIDPLEPVFSSMTTIYLTVSKILAILVCVPHTRWLNLEDRR